MRTRIGVVGWYVYQRGVLNPPGGTRPFLGLGGVTTVGSGTMTPGQPINSPVRGLTGKLHFSKVNFPLFIYSNFEG